MATRLFRKALYDLVWSEPMHLLSAKLGISDAELETICAKVQIPVPNPSYWMKGESGQIGSRTALTTRPPGMDDEIEIRIGGEEETDDILGPLPQSPGFPEPIQAVRDRITLVVGKVTIPNIVRVWHPAVDHLLMTDERRRKRQHAGTGYISPRFDTPCGQRRLRIVNAVLTATAMMNGKAEVDASDIDYEQPDDGKMRIVLSFYGTLVKFTLNPIDQSLRSSAINLPLASDGPKLALAINREFGPEGRPSVWEDFDETPLESQLTEIAIELILTAEIQYRTNAIERYHQRVETMVKLQLRKIAAEQSEKEWLERIEQLLSVRRYRQVQVGRRRRQKGSVKDRGDGWWKIRWREYYIDARTGVEKSTYRQELWSKKQYPTEQLVRIRLSNARCRGIGFRDGLSL